ncbi:MAG: family 1 glycosylhydrolase [Acidimicrobiales bacterium]
MSAFPEGFWWGTGASSTQTEGAAPTSDWYRWEHAGRAPLSGDGNGFATRYAEDLRLYADHGLTHHRLSLEWARLEPTQGRHDPAAVEHYREVLTVARDVGISVWACLQHVTLPGWFADDLGGFVPERNRIHWHRHVDWVAETFGDLIFGWKPVHQPHAYAVLGFQTGLHPPGVADEADFAEALEAIHLANHEAWRLLRSGDQPVATIHDLTPVHPAVRTDNPHERTAADERAHRFDEAAWCWTRALREGVLQVPGRPAIELPDMAGSFDLIGFSYAFAMTMFTDGVGPYPADARVGPLGYAPWPEGLGLVLRRLAEELPGRPLVIDECGFGTDDDEWRTSLLRESLEQVEMALDDGLDIRGLFHRTGVDGYEWDEGFDVPFGLFDRDRAPKGSAELARAWATGTN